MTQLDLHHIIILSVVSLQCCRSWAQLQLSFVPSIVPSEVEGQTLEVPIGGSRQISFTVTYIPQGIEYRADLHLNGRKVNVGNNNFESSGDLNIVSRTCEDSNRPQERCVLLQVTVNGETPALNLSRLQFAVRGVDPVIPEYISGNITLRIAESTTAPPTTTAEPVPTTEAPLPTTTNTIVDSNQGERSDQCESATAETIVPWVFVALLSALLLLTIAILILVICKYRHRPDSNSKLGVEAVLPMATANTTPPSNSVQPTHPENSDTSSQVSSSKNSLAETGPETL